MVGGGPSCASSGEAAANIANCCKACRREVLSFLMISSALNPSSSAVPWHNGTRTNGNSAGTAPTKPSKPTSTAGGWLEIACYPYMGRDGSLLFEVIRY